MKVNIITPYAVDKNLGRAYNEMCALIPDDQWICIMDHDSMLLTPDAGKILHDYAELNPGCLLTCYANRTHPTSPQVYYGEISENDSIRYHIERAEKQKELLYQTRPITSTISGYLMLFPKQLWNEFKFAETNKCLSVDSHWSTLLLKANKEIKLMLGCYVWHSYRIMTRIDDKTHLL